jgi:hypothetical protein
MHEIFIHIKIKHQSLTLHFNNNKYEFNRLKTVFY